MTDGDRIKSALRSLRDDGFGDRATELLSVLGYHSTRIVDEAPMQPEEFVGMYAAESTKSEDVFVSEARSVQVLFQVTDSEMDGQARLDAASYDKSVNKSFLFVAVELKRATYPRGRYAAFTREINKRLKIPAVVLFRTLDSKCTLGFIHRREGIRDPSHHVLERVSLVREISSGTPHRAHVDILHSLSMPERLEWIVNNRKRSNFDGLHDAWLAALDTEELNRRFYRDLYCWFERAVERASLPNNIQPQEHMLRLITRLLFVWFVKQKGLVNNRLFNEHDVGDILVRYDSGGDSYYRAVLQNLFFATLNTEIGRRGFGDTNTSYHYRHEIKDATTLLELFNQTPFINGGLFDCLDEDDSRTDYFVDDIAERRGYSIPNQLFFGKGDNPGLITIFNKYHFTVEESTPLEQEVALDPELLGRVFENLLAAYNPETRDTVRKQTGSYYTPREVVDYIVDKTLAASLAGMMCDSAESAEVVKEKMQKLLDYPIVPDGLRPTDKECSDMVRAISEIKILDPAVGSGAFLVSALHKLTLVLKRIDPENKIWMKLQTDMAKERAGEIFEKASTGRREERLLQINTVFERYSDDFGRKLYLIQNNIYGVDIQSIAIQITKLRFFISLAIEQDANSANPEDNYGVQPLPNLETRFVAANTLVPLNKLAQQTIGQTDDDVRRLESELARNREQYFLASHSETKAACRGNDARLRHQLAGALNKAGDAGYVNEMAKWDPYDQNHSSAWFDAKYMFGISDGFDSVIGNPPYLRQEDISGKQHMQLPVSNNLGIRDHQIPNKSDLSSYFFYHSINLLKSGGRLGFISSGGWLADGYGTTLQRMMLDHCMLESLIQPEFRVFTDASVRTVITMLCRSHERGTVEFVKTSDNGLSGDVNGVAQSELTPGNWITRFNDGIQSVRVPMTALGAVCSVVRGRVTGHNDFFILNGVDVKEWGIGSAHLAPMVPKNLHGAVHLTDGMATEWLLNVSESEGNLAKTPDGRKLRKYLKSGDNVKVPKRGFDRTAKRIRDFTSVKIHKPYWYSLNLGEPAPILVSLIISKRARILENGGGFHSTNRFAYVTPHNPEHIHCLLAYLASSYFSLYQELNGPKSGAGALQLYTNAYKKAPVPNFEKVGADVVAKMQSAWLQYREDLDSEALDGVVYEALGLNPDEQVHVQTQLACLMESRIGAAESLD